MMKFTKIDFAGNKVLPIFKKFYQNIKLASDGISHFGIAEPAIDDRYSSLFVQVVLYGCFMKKVFTGKAIVHLNVKQVNKNFNV